MDMQTAYAEGMRQGHARGAHEGFKRGFEQGRMIGVAEGNKVEKRDSVLRDAGRLEGWIKMANGANKG
jgi:flagellar biosynthesis/type III secretory pathway protein FliH